MAGKQLPAPVWGCGVRGQSGDWYDCVPGLLYATLHDGVGSVPKPPWSRSARCSKRGSLFRRTQSVPGSPGLSNSPSLTTHTACLHMPLSLLYSVAPSPSLSFCQLPCSQASVFSLNKRPTLHLASWPTCITLPKPESRSRPVKYQLIACIGNSSFEGCKMALVFSVISVLILNLFYSESFPVFSYNI